MALPMFGLADVNSFYASCESLFRPDLRGKPVMRNGAIIANAGAAGLLTGVIRRALQDAGRLGQDSVSIVARTPVFVTAKERRLPHTYRAGNEGKLAAEDIKKVAAAAGAGDVIDADNVVYDHITESNADLAEMLGLSGTPGIVVMPTENATPDNITVIPGVVSEQVMQQAITRAEKG